MLFCVCVCQMRWKQCPSPNSEPSLMSAVLEVTCWHWTKPTSSRCLRIKWVWFTDVMLVCTQIKLCVADICENQTCNTMTGNSCRRLLAVTSVGRMLSVGRMSPLLLSRRRRLCCQLRQVLASVSHEHAQLISCVFFACAWCDLNPVYDLIGICFHTSFYGHLHLAVSHNLQSCFVFFGILTSYLLFFKYSYSWGVIVGKKQLGFDIVMNS